MLNICINNSTHTYLYIYIYGYIYIYLYIFIYFNIPRHALMYCLVLQLVLYMMLEPVPMHYCQHGGAQFQALVVSMAEHMHE